MKQKCLWIFLAITGFIISGCSTVQVQKPTSTTSVPSPSSTYTPVPPTITFTPTATYTPTQRPSPTQIPTEYPYSELPGWIAYLDFECSKSICTNISIIRPDFSDRRLLTDHEHGLALPPYWSPDGQYIAYEYALLGEDGGFELRLFDLVQGKMVILASIKPFKINGLSWSPDSRFIVFSKGGNDDENSNIQRINIKSKTTINLTALSSYQDMDPDWSPDGKHIIFASNRNKNGTSSSSIWLMNSDGSGLRNLTSESGSEDFSPSWSPDGTMIAFYRVADRSTESGLYLMNSDGSETRLALRFDQTAYGSPVWSSNGNLIGIMYGEETTSRVLVFDIKTNLPYLLQELDGKVNSLSWSPDSSAMIFVQEPKEMSRIMWLYVFENDKPLFSVNSETPIDFPVWSPVADLP